MAKQAEGCAVLRLSKAAAGLLRLLRPGQNVPCSSFRSPIETVCRAYGEVRWQSKRRVVRWQVVPVWRVLELRKLYNVPWQWQSRHEPCCTPTVIPGAAPPRPRLGRGRRIYCTHTYRITTTSSIGGKRTHTATCHLSLKINNLFWWMIIDSQLYIN